MPNSRYNGPFPTVGDSRHLGMTGFRVECSAQHCHHEKRVEFDALGLPDDTVFLDIPKLRRFVCEKCGDREATVWRGLERVLRRLEWKANAEAKRISAMSSEHDAKATKGMVHPNPSVARCNASTR
jgi:hypothetical protein